MIPLGILAAAGVEPDDEGGFELVWTFDTPDATSNSSAISGSDIGWVSGISTIQTTSAHAYPSNPVAVAGVGSLRHAAVTVSSDQTWTVTEISVQVARGGSSGSRTLAIVAPGGEVLAGGEVPTVRPVMTTLTADALGEPNSGSLRFVVLETSSSTGTVEFDNLTIRGTLD